MGKLLILVFLLVSCDQKSESDSLNYPQKNQCGFTEFIELMELPPEYEREYCPANGHLFTENESAGDLDNCNEYICYRGYSSEIVYFAATTRSCPGVQTPTCSHKGWVFKDCFKFKTADEECECQNGKIICKEN